MILGRALGPFFERPAVDQRLVEAIEVAFCGFALRSPEVVLVRGICDTLAKILQHVRPVDALAREEGSLVTDFRPDHRLRDGEFLGIGKVVLSATNLGDRVLLWYEAAAVLAVLREVVQDDPVFVGLRDERRREVDAPEDIDRVEFLDRS